MSLAQLNAILERMAELERPAEPDHEYLRTMLNGLAETFPVAEDVTLRAIDAKGVPVLEVAAPGADAAGAILYAHGGGYVAGSPHSHGELTARLSRVTGMRVFSLDYRLAPEHPFPAALEDMATAYAWALTQRIPPEQIVLAGDSAGGGLVATALTNLREAGAPLPAGAALLSPWVDLTLSGGSIAANAEQDPVVSVPGLERWAEYYLKGFDAREVRVSPLHADLRDLPPLLIEVGSGEVLLDDATQLAERATAAGVPVTLNVAEGMPHVWQIFAPILDEAQHSIERIGAWIRERVAG